MTDWFQPYRYLDAPLRGRPIFDTLEDLAADVHAWRKARGCRSVVFTDAQLKFDNPEGPRATVVIGIRPTAGEAVIETRTVLTAGENADEVKAVLVAAHHGHFRPRATDAAPDRPSLRLAS